MRAGVDRDSREPEGEARSTAALRSAGSAAPVEFFKDFPPSAKMALGNLKVHWKMTLDDSVARKLLL